MPLPVPIMRRRILPRRRIEPPTRPRHVPVRLPLAHQPGPVPLEEIQLFDALQVPA